MGTGRKQGACGRSMLLGEGVGEEQNSSANPPPHTPQQKKKELRLPPHAHNIENRSPPATAAEEEEEEETTPPPSLSLSLSGSLWLCLSPCGDKPKTLSSFSLLYAVFSSGLSLVWSGLV